MLGLISLINFFMIEGLEGDRNGKHPNIQGDSVAMENADTTCG